MLQAAFKIIKTMEKLDQKRRIDVPETLADFLIMQTFPLYILHHVWKYNVKHFLCDSAQNIPTNYWTPNLRSRLDQFDACVALPLKCGSFSVKVETSKTFYGSVT